MHRCVCIWRYILQNYNYILHVFIKTLAAENLDVCTACDPWYSYWYWYQNLGGAPLGAGHAFPRHRHMRRRGGYLFMPRFSSLYDAIHGSMTGWMDRWMDGHVTWWKKLHEKRPRRPLLYVIINCRLYVSTILNIWIFKTLHK